MERCTKNRRSKPRFVVSLLLVFGWAPSFPLPTPAIAPPQAQARRPIYVAVRFHLDTPEIRDPANPRPTRSSEGIRRITGLLEKLGVKAQYAFVGVVVQQLAEDSPETVEKIKALRLPIAYHGGAGHTEPGPVGRETRVTAEGISPSQAQEAQWEALWRFETRTLVPEWHLEGGLLARGNPRAGQAMTLEELPSYRIPAKEGWLSGGWLAIQEILGVTPLQTDAAGHGSVYEALGAGYRISPGEVELSPLRSPPGLQEQEEGLQVPYSLPALHEPHLFPGGRFGGVPPKYYGKQPGAEAPLTIDPVEWFEILARNLPRDKAFRSGFMCHAGLDWEPFERLMTHLARHGEDFRVATFDPEGFQYRPENAPLVFYRKAYGVESLAEVRSLAAPLERIRALSRGSRSEDRSRSGAGALGGRGSQGPGGRTRPRSLTADQILEAADFVLCHWPQGTHDGDFGGPPSSVRVKGGSVSLADTFEGLVASLTEWQEKGRLPAQVRLRGLRGPVDFPVFDLGVKPKLDPEKAKTGYMPAEIAREFLPDAAVVNSQGLPPSGDYHVWIPTHTKAEADHLMAAVKEVARGMSDHVPGVIGIRVRAEDSRGKEPRWVSVKVNPAEFLYALAQEYRAIRVWGQPGPAVMVSMKITSDQRCQLLLPFTPDSSRGAVVGSARFEGFIWRAKLSASELNGAWTQGAP